MERVSHLWHGVFQFTGTWLYSKIQPSPQWGRTIIILFGIHSLTCTQMELVLHGCMRYTINRALKLVSVKITFVTIQLWLGSELERVSYALTFMKPSGDKRAVNFWGERLASLVSNENSRNEQGKADLSSRKIFTDCVYSTPPQNPLKPWHWLIRQKRSPE